MGNVYGFIQIDAAALMFNCGRATVEALVDMDILKSFKINNETFIIIDSAFIKRAKG